ncbi:MAG: terpene cyclase/mutase family protein [Planctomycetaceae bacterium]|nr:terpene cyclase/mutase family protein [Planctomycetaceae bacterium]
MQPEIHINTDLPKRRKKIVKPLAPPKEHRDIFSEKTARLLLRWLKPKQELPEQLPGLRKKFIKERKHKKPSLSVQEELAAAIRAKLVPWCWSFLLHLCLILLLMFLFLPAKPGTAPFDIILGLGDEISVSKDEEGGGNGNALGDDDNNSITIVAPQNLLPVENPESVSPQMETVETSPDAILDNASERVVLNLAGRDPGSRANQLGGGGNGIGNGTGNGIGDGNGGIGKTDTAVVASLRWLVRNQLNDGSWSLCGPYRDGAFRDKENKIAATAMALLAFQGYGVTPSSSHPQLREFAGAVNNGWNYLLKHQQSDNNPQRDGCFFRDSMPYSHRFYTHGLCTLALCERLAMKGEDANAPLREAAQRAVNYCLQHQSVDGGGWRYDADRWNSDSDVSVTGWIVMALKTAQAAELQVPESTWQKITRFLDTVQKDGGSQYAYREREPEIRVAMTAEALLCRELLGWKQNDTRLMNGVAVLVEPENLPRFDDHYKRDVYYWYYASQTLHHYGKDEWLIWNTKIREELPAHQEQSGSETGSWNPKLPVRDVWGQQFGRLYTTCFSALVLETYYRHQRIYR